MARNLVYVFADQWRGMSIGLECSDIITPAIDAFASESIYFTSAVSSCPLCSPYRACLFTGQYPSSHGVYGNCMTGYPISLPADSWTMLDMLSSSGYDVGYIGKWHLDEPEVNNEPCPPSGAVGWDAYTPPERRHGVVFWHAYNADNNHIHPHYWEDTPEKLVYETWSPIHETNKAIGFLTEHSRKSKPFALFISWNPPHPPYEKVPGDLLSIYRDMDITIRRNVAGESFVNHTGENGIDGMDGLLDATHMYYAAITGLDKEFARLLDAIERLGMTDDTIIVLTSDHGDMMGSHGLVGKHVWYEESIRVPLIIRIPGEEPKKLDMPISTVDILPTLSAFMNEDIPNAANLPGIDLSVPIRQGHVIQKDAYISCYVSRDIFIESLAGKGILPIDAGWRCLRDNDSKLVINRGYMPGSEPEVLLYDLRTDPYEMNPFQLGSPLEAGYLYDRLKNILVRENPGFADWILSYYHC